MEQKGIVFDIQRFSLHDGPGIRTTVFLKGCPLGCIWCHNPESARVEPQLMFYQDKCVHCLNCVGSCPHQAHRRQNGKHAVDFGACKAGRGCKADGACVEACAYGALKMSGKRMSVEEVLQEVTADRDYYRNSGGGLTISGGEPMLQLDFLGKLLQESRKKGLHTCIETSGFAGQEQFERIREYVDLFLFDIKHMNDEEHRKYTGVSNQVILENLEYLYGKGAQILLRCPIIPGINDTEEHIGRVAELTVKYPGLSGTEILPYHDMGKGKWTQIGKEYRLPDLHNVTEEEKQALLQRFLRAGCKNVTV